MASTVPDTGALIYVALKPLIKFALPVAFGYLLALKGLFPLAASRGAGQVILNILIPSLLFSKVVPSFNSDNISALGPIILIGAFYEGFGLAMAWLVRLSLPVPRNFRNGLLVAGMLGNWGDLPFAILQTITASAPFNTGTDPALAQAYACVFMVIFLVTAFPLGGVALIARDYREPYLGDYTHPPLARIASMFWKRVRGVAPADIQDQVDRTDSQAEIDAEKAFDAEEATPQASTSALALAKPEFPPLTQQATNRTVRSTTSSLIQEAGNAGAAPYPVFGRSQPKTVPEVPEEPTRPNTRPNSVYQHVQDVPTNLRVSRSRIEPRQLLASLSHAAADFCRQLLTPPTISLVVALSCALVKPLKALFVHVPDYPFHQAPDGEPVLDVLFQVTAFMGGAAVPTSCIILGSALARIKVPRPITQLPLRAIFALATVKLVLMPIAGIAIVQALTLHTSLVPPGNHVLRYSLLVLSCVPSATQQIVLTVVVAPPDQTSNADLFGCFLLVQYAVLVIASTVVATYSLSLIF